jgi:hypothetical protein
VDTGRPGLLERADQVTEAIKSKQSLDLGKSASLGRVKL